MKKDVVADDGTHHTTMCAQVVAADAREAGIKSQELAQRSPFLNAATLHAQAVRMLWAVDVVLICAAVVIA